MTSTMRSMMTPRISGCLTTYPCHFSRGHPDDIDNEEYDDTENKWLLDYIPVSLQSRPPR